MIINFSNLGGGGGGGEYVLPAATENRLGGVKIGNGVNVAADGTISVDGGGSGDSNYLIVDSLDEIESPVEGMKAYVRASEQNDAHCYTYTKDGIWVIEEDIVVLQHDTPCREKIRFLFDHKWLISKAVVIDSGGDYYNVLTVDIGYPPTEGTWWVYAFMGTEIYRFYNDPYGTLGKYYVTSNITNIKNIMVGTDYSYEGVPYGDGDRLQPYMIGKNKEYLGNEGDLCFIPGGTGSGTHVDGDHSYDAIYGLNDSEGKQLNLSLANGGEYLFTTIWKNYYNNTISIYTENFEVEGDYHEYNIPYNPGVVDNTTFPLLSFDMKDGYYKITKNGGGKLQPYYGEFTGFYSTAPEYTPGRYEYMEGSNNWKVLGNYQITPSLEAIENPYDGLLASTADGVYIYHDGWKPVSGGSGGDGLEIVNYNDIDTAKGQEIFANPEKYVVQYGTEGSTQDYCFPSMKTDSYVEFVACSIGFDTAKGLSRHYLNVVTIYMSGGKDYANEQENEGYSIVSALSDISNPVEGMKVYSKNAQRFTAYKFDFRNRLEYDNLNVGRFDGEDPEYTIKCRASGISFPGAGSTDGEAPTPTFLGNGICLNEHYFNGHYGFYTLTDVTTAYRYMLTLYIPAEMTFVPDEAYFVGTEIARIDTYGHFYTYKNGTWKPDKETLVWSEMSDEEKHNAYFYHQINKSENYELVLSTEDLYIEGEKSQIYPVSATQQEDGNIIFTYIAGKVLCWASLGDGFVNAWWEPLNSKEYVDLEDIIDDSELALSVYDNIDAYQLWKALDDNCSIYFTLSGDFGGNYDDEGGVTDRAYIEWQHDNEFIRIYEDGEVENFTKDEIKIGDTTLNETQLQALLALLS